MACVAFSVTYWKYLEKNIFAYKVCVWKISLLATLHMLHNQLWLPIYFKTNCHHTHAWYFQHFLFDLPLLYRGTWSFSPSSITWSSYQCISKCCFSFSSFLKLSFSYIIQLQHCFTGFFVFFLSILFWFDLTLLAPPSSFQAKLSLWVFHSMFSQFQNFQRLIW